MVFKITKSDLQKIIKSEVKKTLAERAVSRLPNRQNLSSGKSYRLIPVARDYYSFVNYLIVELANLQRVMQLLSSDSEEDATNSTVKKLSLGLARDKEDAVEMLELETFPDAVQVVSDMELKEHLDKYKPLVFILPESLQRALGGLYY